MATLRNLVVALTARTEAFQAGMTRAQRDLQNLRRSVEQTQQGFAAFTNRVTAAAGAFVSLQTGQAVLRSIVQSSLQLQSTNAAFKAITGSAQGAADAFGFIRDEAKRLGLDAVALADGFKGISAAARGTTLEGQQTRQIFTAVAEASRVLQLSTEQAQGALVAITQMISKGTVSAEELRGQLGERLPGAFQIAARAMGVTTQELGKMLEKGQIISAEFLPKFAAQLRREMGGAVVEASQTAGAAFARFNNAVRDITTSIGQESGLLTMLARAAEGFAKLATQALRVEEVARARKDIESILSPEARGAARGTELRDIERVQQNITELTRRLVTLRTQGRGIFEAGRLEQEIAALEKQRAAMSDLLEKRAALNKAIQRGADISESFIAPTQDFAEVLTSRADAIGKVFTEAQEQLTLLNRQAQFMPKTFNVVQERAKIATKALEDMAAAIAATPALAEKLPEDLSRSMGALMEMIDAAERQKDAVKDQREEEREAAREAKALQRELAQEAEEHERLLGDIAQRRQENIDQILAGLAREQREFGKTSDEIARMELVALQAGSATMAMADALMEANQAARSAQRQMDQLVATEMRAAQTAVIIAEGRFEQIQRQARLNAEIEAQIRETQTTTDDIFTSLRASTDDLATSIIDSLQNMASEGEFSWKKLADSAIREMNRMVREAIGVDQWLSQLLKVGVNALVGTAGGLSAGSAPLSSGTTPSAGVAFGEGRQHGGWAMPGRAYLVGERGPEVLTMGNQKGYVHPNAGGGNVHINMTINTPNADSFRKQQQQIMRDAYSEAERQMKRSGRRG